MSETKYPPHYTIYDCEKQGETKLEFIIKGAVIITLLAILFVILHFYDSSFSNNVVPNTEIVSPTQTPGSPEDIK